jgi:hypothetical protein
VIEKRYLRLFRKKTVKTVKVFRERVWEKVFDKRIFLYCPWKFNPQLSAILIA